MTGTRQMDTAPAGRRGGSRAHTALGRYGEDVAARWLQARGHEVVARNWRGPAGELDLVTRHAGWWVAVEVKTRSGTGFGDPLEAVTPAKLRRLHRLMAAWMHEHASPIGLGVRARDPWRVDAVAVLVPRGGGVRVDHVQDVRP
ncbi:YraN family protein [Micrococcus sp.]|uniref:YraN family protein n=1 Tax=Micrococcus sp. TaxID=1271 RepID=UPI002A91028A|nr:YraN family protein [Micrococcus sp.]MDY6054305.1 YraN family protein [Micrococcus sp.]